MCISSGSNLLPPHNHEREPGQQGLIMIRTVSLILLYIQGPDEVKHRVGLDEIWEAVHFFLHFTDSELNAKMRE
jgi:hypothetical protein